MMKKIDWQYYSARGMSKLVCLLPYNIVLKAGSGIGKLAYKLLKKQRNRAIEQCSQCLQIDAAAADVIVRKMFDNLGKMIVEIFWTPHIAHGKIAGYSDIDGREHIEELAKTNGGAIILTAHYGNWEWMAALGVQLGFPIAAIARFTDRGIDRFINAMRQLTGWKVFKKGGREVAIGAIKALKAGDYLTFLMDGDAGGDQGVWTDFFGRPSSTHAGAAFFAAKYNAPVLPVFMRRKAKGHTMKVYPIMFYREADTEKNSGVREFAQKLNTIIETEIREHPENWLWFQKRWNSKLCLKA